ncbi:unnamed protein product [Didymodactylos carnosus]|uniref:Uncharacterized protein n=1 Tax=Didymodactylos carnosus TaxID=1234261 RepID=A0A813PDS2_9BILA|nr:unnamed protein product [Didymodactylos carnosus]
MRKNRVQPDTIRLNGDKGQLSKATVTTTTTMQYVRRVQVVPMSDAIEQLQNDIDHSFKDIKTPNKSCMDVAPTIIPTKSKKTLWFVGSLFITFGLVGLAAIIIVLSITFGKNNSIGLGDIERECIKRYDIGDLFYGMNNLVDKFVDNSQLSADNSASVQKWLTGQLQNEQGFRGLFVSSVLVQQNNARRRSSLESTLERTTSFSELTSELFTAVDDTSIFPETSNEYTSYITQFDLLNTSTLPPSLPSSTTDYNLDFTTFESSSSFITSSVSKTTMDSSSKFDLVTGMIGSTDKYYESELTSTIFNFNNISSDQVTLISSESTSHSTLFDGLFSSSNEDFQVENSTLFDNGSVSSTETVYGNYQTETSTKIILSTYETTDFPLMPDLDFTSPFSTVSLDTSIRSRTQFYDPETTTLFFPAQNTGFPSTTIRPARQSTITDANITNLHPTTIISSTIYATSPTQESTAYQTNEDLPSNPINTVNYTTTQPTKVSKHNIPLSITSSEYTTDYRHTPHDLSFTQNAYTKSSANLTSAWPQNDTSLKTKQRLSTTNPTYYITRLTENPQSITSYAVESSIIQDALQTSTLNSTPLTQTDNSIMSTRLSNVSSTLTSNETASLSTIRVLTTVAPVMNTNSTTLLSDTSQYESVKTTHHLNVPSSETSSSTTSQFDETSTQIYSTSMSTSDKINSDSQLSSITTLSSLLSNFTDNISSSSSVNGLSTKYAQSITSNAVESSIIQDALQTSVDSSKSNLNTNTPLAGAVSKITGSTFYSTRTTSTLNSTPLTQTDNSIMSTRLSNVSSTLTSNETASLSTIRVLTTVAPVMNTNSTTLLSDTSQYESVKTTHHLNVPSSWTLQKVI